MATVAENLQTLIDIKDDIKSSIIAKGVPVADTDGFATYPSKIDAIQSGGGGAVKIVDGTRFEYSTFTEWPGYDVSDMTKTDFLCYHCEGLTTANNINVENTTTCSYMFGYTLSLETVNGLKLGSGCTSTDKMFYDTPKLTQVELFDTSSVTSMEDMFNNNNHFNHTLLHLPTFNTTNVYNFRGWCRGNYKLMEFPPIDTAKGLDFTYMARDCAAMTTVPELNMSRASDDGLNQMFQNCPKITTMGGFRNLGLGFKGFVNAELNLSSSTALTVESVQNIGNTIYDLNLSSAHTTTATIKIATAVYNQLSPEDIALFTNKKWVLTAV